MSTTERWLPVPGYEGHYEVSDHGRVRSLDRVVKRGKFEMRAAGVPLALYTTRHGYHRVTLIKPGFGERKLRAHRLVLEAFVGPCPDGMEACHNDGNPSNNRLENLRWDTRSNNLLDTVRHGTHPGPQKTHCPQGHPYDEINTYYRGRCRGCRICRRESRRRAERAARERRSA